MAEFKVPLIDLKERYQEEKDELLSCVERVLDSGNLVLPPELADFEERVAQYTKSKHCIGLNSGTDALMMGVHAMGIGKGDEVITSPISFIATTAAKLHSRPRNPLKVVWFPVPPPTTTILALLINKY